MTDDRRSQPATVEHACVQCKAGGASLASALFISIGVCVLLWQFCQFGANLFVQKNPYGHEFCRCRACTGRSLLSTHQASIHYYT